MTDEKKKYKKIIKRDKRTGEIIDEQIVEIKDNEPIKQERKTKYAHTNKVNPQRPSETPPASNNNMMKFIVIGLLALIAILLIALLVGRNKQNGTDVGTNTETEYTSNFGDTETDEFIIDTETSETETETEALIGTDTETETETTTNAGAAGLPQGPYDFANEPNGDYRQIIYDSLDVAFSELSDVYYEDIDGQAVYYLYPTGTFEYTVTQMPNLYEDQTMQDSWNYMVEALQQMNGEFAQILEEDITLHVVDPEDPTKNVITIVNDRIEYDLLQDLLGNQI